jgi:hypothetical protein
MTNTKTQPEPSQVQATNAPASSNGQDAPVVVPKIDFTTPTEHPLVGIREGFGIVTVGGSEQTAPSDDVSALAS